jgi:hypothetical protein
MVDEARIRKNLHLSQEQPGHLVDVLKAQHADSETRTVRICLFTILFAALFLQRFAMPGSGGIALNLFFTIGALGWLVLRGTLSIDPFRAILFCAFAAVVSLSTALNASVASTGSVLLVALIYAPMTLSLNKSENIFNEALCLFQKIVVVLAFCGIAQFFGQFFLGSQGYLLFSFSHFIPSDLLVPDFNTEIPLYWGASIYKSNGFFLVEPSTFSQYLSLAAIFEILIFGTTWRFFFFIMTLPITYSGTGPIVLVAMLPWLLLRRRLYGALVGTACVGLIAIATGPLWHIEVILGRIGEFGAEGTSATARFLAGAWLIADTMGWSLREITLGMGAGTIQQAARLAAYEAHDPVWAKVFFEYGALGVATFGPMVFVAMFSNAPSLGVSIALGIGFLSFGGMMLDPRLHALILVFCVLPKCPSGKELNQLNRI